MRRGRSLLEDEGGAMMLIALFMALFLIGLLYFLMGVGDAILYRRLMQDAADAGAYGASVTAARGMNLHVLLNIIMMVTAGILLIIRTVERIFQIAFGITFAANLGCFGCLSREVAMLKTAEATTAQLGDRVERFVSEAHDALDKAHGALEKGFPALAIFRASSASTEYAYQPPVSQGFALPMLQASLPGDLPSFPLEEGSVGTHCDRFQSEVREGVSGALSSVGGAVADLSGRALGAVLAGGLKLGKPKTCKDSILEPPRRVLAKREDGSVLFQGQEEFQYRAFVIGESPSRGYWKRGEQGVALANGGLRPELESGRDLAELGAVAFAQSEYYFDSDAEKAHWMWRMKWRGRLRRFRMPAKMRAALSLACSGPVAACDALLELATDMESVH